METLIKKSESQVGSTSMPKFRLPAMMKIGQEVIWVAFGQLAAALGSFGSVYFLTKQLSTHAYGELAFGLAFAALAQGYFSCVANGFLRYMPVALEKKDVPRLIHAVRTIVFHGTLWHLGTTVVAVLFAAMIGMERWILFLLATSVLALLTGYVCAIESLQIGLRDRSSVALQRGSIPWCRVACAVGFVLLLEPITVLSPGLIAIGGFVVGTILVLIPQYFKLQRSIKKLYQHPPVSDAVNIDWLKRNVNYSLPFAAFFLLSYIQLFADRWALKVFVTNSELGLYSAVYQLGFAPMMLLAGFTAQLMGPILFKRAGDGSQQDRINKSLAQNHLVILATLLFGVCCSIVAFFLHAWIFKIVLKAEYQIVSAYLPWLMLSGGLFAAGNAASLSSMIAAKPRMLMIPTTLAAIAAIGSTFLGGYLGGLRGVFIAVPIHFTFHFIVMIYSTRFLKPAEDKPEANDNN